LAEKKEQNNPASEEDERVLGSGLGEFRWSRWFMVFQRRRGLEDRE